MKIADIRTTVIRSNPQMIRIIHIALESSLETLGKAVSICYGLSPESCGLSDGDLSGVKVEALSVGESFELDVHMDLEQDEPFANILVEVMSMGETDDYLCPTLLESCGYQFVDRANSLGEMNEWMYRFEDFGTAYSWKYGDMPGEEYICRIPRVNRKLQKLFAPETMEVQVVSHIGKPLEGILTSLSVEKLRDIVDYCGFPLNKNYSKRSILCDMQSFYDEDFYQDVLDDLSCEEYGNLRDFCKTGKYIEGTMESIGRVGLLTKSPLGQVYLAAEFLDFFDNWLLDGNEEIYLSMRKYRPLILGSCRLYGFVTREMVRQFFPHYYPGDIWEEAEFNRVWKQISEDGLNPYGFDRGSCVVMDSDTLYWGVALTRRDVLELMELWKDQSYDAYMPSLEELSTIIEFGFSFSVVGHYELHQALTKIVGVIHANAALEEVGDMCHADMTVQDIVRTMVNYVGWVSVRDKNTLESCLKKYKDDVRKAALKGHTVGEIQS